jgi:cytochrome c oxidase assembly protein subunit 15
MASILPGLRKAAPRLSRDFFICHQCVKQTRPALPRTKIPGKSALSRNIRFNSNTAAFAEPAGSPLASLSQTITHESARSSPSKKSFPEISSKGAAYWLLGSAASVFGIVVFGGLTRLTESGYGYLPRKLYALSSFPFIVYEFLLSKSSLTIAAVSVLQNGNL